MSNEVMKASFSDMTITRGQDGEYHAEEIEALAAGAVDQTQPLDVEDDVDAGVPRDESVGLDQTDADYLKYEQDYERGKDNTDSKVVPRSTGDSGISGWEKTTFDDEGANKATSGNPDDYVQTYQENVAPSKAGTAENHVAEDDAELEKTASDNSDIQQLAEKVEQLEKELHKEKTLRVRESIASKIVNLEVSANLLELNDDALDQRIKDMALQTPVESLNRELERTRSLVAKLQNEGTTVGIPLEKTSGLQTGAFSGFDSEQMPALQTMFVSSDVNNDEKHMPKSYIDTANSAAGRVDALRRATSGTYLNRVVGQK